MYPVLEPAFHMPKLKDIVLLVPRMLGATFSAAVEVFYVTAVNGWPDTAASRSTAGRVAWAAGVGDRLQHRLSITNTSQAERDFSVTTHPFRGTSTTVESSVSRMRLAAGETRECVLSLTVPAALAGGHYSCRVEVQGAVVQQLVLELTVKPQQAGVSFVELGD